MQPGLKDKEFFAGGHALTPPRFVLLFFSIIIYIKQIKHNNAEYTVG